MTSLTKARISLRLIMLTAVFLFSFGMCAQTVPVGMPVFDDGLRLAQLRGVYDADVSFTIRPLQPARLQSPVDLLSAGNMLFANDSTNNKAHAALRLNISRSQGQGWKAERTEQISRANFRLEPMPLVMHTRFNGHHPYGWSDGPMVPSKGLQQYVSAGFFMKAGLFEAQLMPEFVYAQNKPFQNPPARPRDIDMPERMGQEPYRRFFPGQSFVRLQMGPVSVGYSTENIWYGPGMKNSIILTNNAPGFRHFSLMTNRPVKTPVGTFEAHMAAGRLHRSGFKWPSRYEPGTWPPIAGDVTPDTVNGTKAYGYTNTMALTWQPKWLPGLFLGATRAVQAKGDPDHVLDYFKILYLSARGENLTNQPSGSVILNRNQLASVFFRYFFPGANAEIYMEIGREDFWYDFQDLLTRLQYSTAYNLGFRKLHILPQPNHWLEVSAEYTKIQAPFGNLVGPGISGYSFYTHGELKGWTHFGQVLGSGIGPGSNMMTFGLRHSTGSRTFGLHFERVAYNEDLFYTALPYLRLGSGANPFFVDASKHFVDWGFLLSHQNNFGRLSAGLLLHILKTYNFQWNYDPNGQPDPFRFPGINPWSLNSELSLTYRF
ncbi:MAG TPA: capsule assembly Wzi family protein [Bacteroidales bacterium]|nr:capsule assembly Wzi family protein [Bacteroidales bacterium]